MQIHITNIYGQSFTSTALKAQNRVAAFARELNYKELGIYNYNVNSDSPEMLSSRLDGIIASVGYGDIVIFQYPTWNHISYDEAFVRRLSLYKDLKKVIFVHDIPSLMFESNRYLLGRHIAFLNQADLIILPSKRMCDFLYDKGLTVPKTVIQKMWDFPVTVDVTVRPKFRKVINFAGDPDSWKFEFVKKWNYDSVELKVTAGKVDWAQGKNISFLGWFNDDTFLVNALRHSGGFGLLWSDNSYWCEYMKLNTNYKLSAYLSAGIPVIVNNNIAEKDTIIHKNLGMGVDSLDEAVSKVENMNEEEYNKMAANTEIFSELIRQGYFAKKALTDAVFQLLYD
ncbi:MAG: sugar transferase [Lachnospiraceae bacterium]|nr:sugar transferase [Lachnospiraceae bacterium]